MSVWQIRTRKSYSILKHLHFHCTAKAGSFTAVIGKSKIQYQKRISIFIICKFFIIKGNIIYCLWYHLLYCRKINILFQHGNLRLSIRAECHNQNRKCSFSHSIRQQISRLCLSRFTCCDHLTVGNGLRIIRKQKSCFQICSIQRSCHFINRRVGWYIITCVIGHIKINCYYASCICIIAHKYLTHRCFIRCFAALSTAGSHA